jgi:hypothetical protein
MNYRKLAGWSVIALGAADFALTLVGQSYFDCNALIFIWAGFAVLHGSRAGRIVALVLSIFQFLVGLAAVVSCLVHGVTDFGLWNAVTGPAAGIWAFLNMALLTQLREPAAAASDPPRPFQYSLRSLFVLTFLVAIACWWGTRPLPPNDHWDEAIGFASPGGVGLWTLDVAGYDSGTPVVGYLWRSEGKRTAHGPGRRLLIEGDGNQHYILMVDGKTIRPEKDFQLFVNDSQDNPLCLKLPRQEAIEIFGKRHNFARIEKFWTDVVEPMRKKG